MKVCNKKTEVKKYRKLKRGQVVAWHGDMNCLRFIVEYRGELIAFDFEGESCNSVQEFLTAENYTPVKGCFVLEEE